MVLYSSADELVCSFCIPFTKAKGVRHIVEGKNKTNSRGIHKLKWWILYDFIVCCIIAALVFMTMNEPNYKIMFYWIKCLYDGYAYRGTC